MPLGIVSYRGLRARDQGSTGAESLSSHSLDPHAVVTPGFNVKGKDGITFVTISGKRPKTWPEQKMDIFIIFAVWSQEFLPLFSRQKTIAVGTVNQTTQLLLLPPFSLSSLPPTLVVAFQSDNHLTSSATMPSYHGVHVPPCPGPPPTKPLPRPPR